MRQRTQAIQSTVDCFDKKFTLLVSVWPIIISVGTLNILEHLNNCYYYWF